MARVLVGLTGSVSVYKAINVIRLLERKGHDVRVVLTPSVGKFLSPLLIKSLTKGEVYTDEDLWNAHGSLHIDLAKWADLLVIVPCTANTLSKLRYSLADNLLTLVCAAFKGPLVIAPAMHSEMWLNPEIQNIVDYLKENRNVFFSGPEKGELASGEVGCGRLLREDYILEDIEAVINGAPLKGVNVLVVYGRTEEPLDPVRVITNRSSGLMGFYLSKAVTELGGDLMQIVGETSIEPYGRGEVVRVRTSSEMLDAVKREVSNAKVLIMAAAVSDYAPVEISSEKLKKKETMIITLRETKDILKEISPLKREDQIFVGFALESVDLEKYAKEKMEKKKVDIIVANYTNSMGSETISGFILDRNGNKDEFSNLRKEEFAHILLKKVAVFVK